MPATDNNIIFTNARVFDGRKLLPETQDVAIAGGRIAAVGAALPADGSRDHSSIWSYR